MPWNAACCKSAITDAARSSLVKSYRCMSAMNASTHVAAMPFPEVYQPIARLHANNYSRQSVCVDQAGPSSPPQ